MTNGPLSQRCQVYDWPSFFNKKYMNDLIFLDSYVKGPIFLTTSYKWVQKKIKGQYINRSAFRMIQYMTGSVFSKAGYMNGVGFEILARTPVPQLTPNYPTPAPPPPPPPPRHPRTEGHIKTFFLIFLRKPV